MLARHSHFALAALAAWTLVTGVAHAQKQEPKPQTEAEAEERFGVKSKPEPKPQSEPQVEHALSQTSYVRGGWYIGFEGLAILENSKYVGGPVGGPDKHLMTGGLDFRMGNRHNRWLATEIQGTWVNSYKTNYYKPDDYENDFTIWGIWVNERVYLTKSRIQPFLTGGLGVIQIRTEYGGEHQPGEGDDPLGSGSSKWGFSALLGIGVEIFWTENFVTTVGLNYYFTTGGIKDHDFATAGIGFQFF